MDVVVVVVVVVVVSTRAVARVGIRSCRLVAVGSIVGTVLSVQCFVVPTVFVRFRVSSTRMGHGMYLSLFLTNYSRARTLKGLDSVPSMQTIAPLG
jgi:hypothetical protein